MTTSTIYGHKFCLGLLKHFICLILAPLLFTLEVIFILKAHHGRKTFKKFEWAPINVPVRRRMETLAVTLMMFVLFILEPLSIYIVCMLIIFGNIFCRVSIIVYIIYLYYDNVVNYNIKSNVGAMFPRKYYFWYKHIRNYFPVELIKTADLNPDRNYILASFPHGVMCIHIFVNMVFEITKWMELFPGVRPMLATLDFNFRIPFFKNVIQSLGCVPVSKESLEHLMQRSCDPQHSVNLDGFTSNAISILVGGAHEAANANPKNYKIFLKHRKGFVKIAIATGSAIVPSFCFGENDLFDQEWGEPGTLIHKYQQFIKNICGIWPLIIIGRGLFQYSFGFLPRRKPLVQIVGAPIDVIQCENPSQEYIDQIHQKVIDALKDIFEKHKRQHIADCENVKLIIE